MSLWKRRCVLQRTLFEIKQLCTQEQPDVNFLREKTDRKAINEHRTARGELRGLSLGCHSSEVTTGGGCAACRRGSTRPAKNTVTHRERARRGERDREQRHRAHVRASSSSRVLSAANPVDTNNYFHPAFPSRLVIHPCARLRCRVYIRSVRVVKKKKTQLGF